MMPVWMRLLLIVLTSACSAGGSVSTEHNKKIKPPLTLEILPRHINGQDQAELILCQAQQCQNPLRNKDGSVFYFQDHSQAYNDFAKTKGIAKTVKFALKGIAVVSLATGAVLLFRHGSIGRKLDEAFPLVKGADGKFHVGKTGKISNVEAARLNKESDLTFKYGFAALSIGSVSWMGAFAQELTNDPHWRRKQQDFEKLFVHGERITVTKKELNALLQVLNKKLEVQVAPNIVRFLYTR